MIVDHKPDVLLVFLLWMIKFILKRSNLPNTIKLLLILFASSKVFPSLCVFLVISLPARSTKLILPDLDIKTPFSAGSSHVMWTDKIV